MALLDPQLDKGFNTCYRIHHRQINIMSAAKFLSLVPKTEIQTDPHTRAPPLTIH